MPNEPIDNGPKQNGDHAKETPKAPTSSSPSDSTPAQNLANSLQASPKGAGVEGLAQAKAYKVTRHQSVVDMPPDVLESVAYHGETLEESHNENAQEEIEKVHIQKSKDMILDAASLAPPGNPRKALILGPGPAADIPLEELARDFDEVTLVEMDLERIKLAVEKLPLNLQAKFHIIHADVTGGLYKQYDKTLQNLFNTASSLDEFMYNATTATFNMQPKPAQFEQDAQYAFVCSQLVGSQLPVHVRAYLFQFAQKHYGPEATGIDDPDFDKKLRAYDTSPTESLDLKVVNAHMQTVANAVAPGGIAYVADATEYIEGGIPQLGTTSEDVDIPDDLDEEKRDNWTYAVFLDDPDTGAPGRSFNVTAKILRKN